MPKRVRPTRRAGRVLSRGCWLARANRSKWPCVWEIGHWGGLPCAPGLAPLTCAWWPSRRPPQRAHSRRQHTPRGHVPLYSRCTAPGVATVRARPVVPSDCCLCGDTQCAPPVPPRPLPSPSPSTTRTPATWSLRRPSPPAVFHPSVGLRAARAVVAPPRHRHARARGPLSPPLTCLQSPVETAFVSLVVAVVGGHPALDATGCTASLPSTQIGRRRCRISQGAVLPGSGVRSTPCCTSVAV